MSDDVPEPFIAKASQVAYTAQSFRGINTVHFGGFLQAAGFPIEEMSTAPSAIQQRRRVIDKAGRMLRRLAREQYQGHEAFCFSAEVSTHFGYETFTEAKARMSTDQAEDMTAFIQSRLIEVLS